MKPPPFMLSGFMLLRFMVSCFMLSSFMFLVVAGAKSACNQFKNNISLKPIEELIRSSAIATYITHSDDPRLTITCHISDGKKGKSFQSAIVSNSDGTHLVTLRDFWCDYTGLIKNTYMSHIENSKDKVLIVGFLPKEEVEMKVWCQYKICYSCRRMSSLMAIKREDKFRKNLTYFQWSKKGILVVPNKGYTYEELGTIKKEFLSYGDDKFVLTCHENGSISIRTTSGCLIVVIRDLNCYPDEYIQTFYVLSIEKTSQNHPKVLNTCRLGHCKWHQVLTPPTGGTETMFYYFPASTKSQQKMCYWAPIELPKPNTCPSITDDNFEINSDYIRELFSTHEYEVKAVYKKKFLTLYHFEFEDASKVRFPMVVVKDFLGDYLVTLKSVYFSTIENFHENFFIHTTFDDEKTKSFVLGSRWHPEDDWCTYSFQPPMGNGNKLIYYDYTPPDTAFKWEKVIGDVNECPSLKKTDLHLNLNYAEPTEDDSIGKYLFFGREKESFILECYHLKNNKNKVNIVKELNGRTIVSIIREECMISSYKTHLMVQTIKEFIYLIIVTMDVFGDHCKYAICIDCEKREILTVFQSFPPTLPIKSNAGVKWTHEPNTLREDFNRRPMRKQYSTVGKTVFVLVCYNQPEWLLRTASGKRIGIISSLTASCDEIPSVYIYFYTRTATESKVYTGDDCRLLGCDVHPSADKEVWFFYSQPEYGSGNFLDTNEQSVNECFELSHVDFILKKEPERSTQMQNSKKTTYWNGGTPKMTMTCYRLSEWNYAEIEHDGKHILSVNNIHCSGPEEDSETHDENVTQFYIHTPNEDGETNQIVTGMIGTRLWCYYAFKRDVEGGDRWVYFNYRPDELATRWYREGTCDELPRENIVINEDHNGDSTVNSIPIKTYVSIISGENKLLYCYDNFRSGLNYLYTTVIKSLNGKHYITFKGLDCSDLKKFSLNQFSNKEKKYLSVWTLSSMNVGCRYDICMNCETAEILFNIDRSKSLNNIIRWSLVVDETSQEYFQDYNRVTVRFVSLEQPNVDGEDYTLIMKYLSEDESKLRAYHYDVKDTLLELQKYAYVFTDASGTFLFQIVYFVQSFQEYLSSFIVAHDSNFPDELFFVRVFKEVYVICRKCDLPFIATMENYDDYGNLNLLSWKPVDLEECLNLKPTDLSVDENTFQIDDNYQITRYINYQDDDIELYELTCHSKVDSKHKSIAVIRDLSRKHVLSINGIDCSSSSELTTDYFISIKKDKQEGTLMVYLGTAFQFGKSRCQYEVCTGSNTCDPQPKFSYDRISKDDWFKWSESGIKMEMGPPLEIKGPCAEPGKCELMKTYWMNEYTAQLYTLECYQSASGDHYYWILRTMKGYYIQTLESTHNPNCESNPTLNVFYITKHSNKKHKAFKMDEKNIDIDIDLVIESFWEKEHDEEMVELWFYPFFNKLENNLWQKPARGKEICPSINVQDLELLHEGIPHNVDDRLVAEYLNGGKNRAKLSIYQAPGYVYAIITDTINNGQQLLKINPYPYYYTMSIYLEYLYIDIEEFVTVIGSGRETEKMCYYSVFRKGDAIQVRRFFPVTLSLLAAQWYQTNGVDCPTIKRQNIITDESLKINLDKDKPVSFHISYISTNAVPKKYEVFYDCYKMKNEQGTDMFVMVLSDFGGKHMATVKDFDCSLEKSLVWEHNFFAVAIKERNYPTYLFLGSREAVDDGWCQYGFCLDCETEELRKTIRVPIVIDTEKIIWSHSVSRDCPAAKRENIFVHEDGINLNDSKELSVYVLTAFSSLLSSVFPNKFEKKGTFLIYCYYNENDNGQRKYTMVVRLKERRLLVTVDDYDCSSDPKQPMRFQENIYLYTMVEKERLLLVLGTRKSAQYTWCQYNICLNCATTEIRRSAQSQESSLLGLFITTIIFKWMPEIQVLNSLVIKDESKTDVEPNNEAILQSKYQNGKFVIECYVIISEYDIGFTVIVIDQYGKRVKKLNYIPCERLETIKRRFKVFNSKLITAEKDDDLLIGFSLREENICRRLNGVLYSCNNYPREEVFLDFTDIMENIDKLDVNIKFKTEWVTVSVDACYTLPESNIYIQHHSAFDLTGYRAIASYISVNIIGEDTYTIVCYINDNPDVSERIVTRLRTLGRGIDIVIKNLNCESKYIMSRTSYFTAVKGESSEWYILVGTRLLVKGLTGPWCRYDVCTSCNGRVIRVGDVSDPDELTIFEWSEPGHEITSPGKPTSCEGKNIEFLPLKATYAHFKHSMYSIECRDLSLYSSNICSVFTVNRKPILTISSKDCMATSIQIKSFYVYTFNKNFQHSLIKLGSMLNEHEYVSLTKDIDEQWFYHVSGRESPEDWRLVTNINFKSLSKKNFNDGEEQTVCLPKYKTWSDSSDLPKLKNDKK